MGSLRQTPRGKSSRGGIVASMIGLLAIVLIGAVALLPRLMPPPPAAVVVLATATPTLDLVQMAGATITQQAHARATAGALLPTPTFTPLPTLTPTPTLTPYFTYTPSPTSATTLSADDASLTALAQFTQAASVRLVTATPTEKVIIRWFIGLGAGTNAQQIETQNKVVEWFNAQQNAIEVQLLISQNASAQDTLNILITTGNPPDIVGPVSMETANNFPNAWLDLQPLVEQAHFDLSMYDPAILAIYQNATGGVQGLPFAVYPSALYYNRALFDAANLPYPPTEFGAPYILPDGQELVWNYDTLAEIARRLTLDTAGKNATDARFDSANITQFGFQFQWTTQRRIWTNLQPAPFYDPMPHRATLPAAWRTATDWLFEGLWQSHFMPNDQQRSEGGNDFAAGKTAMTILPLWYTCCVLDAQFDWDVAVVPRSLDGEYHVLTDADTFFIGATTQHPIETFAFLQYLITAAAPELLHSYGGFSALSDYQAAYFAALDERYGGDIRWDVFTRSLAYANPGTLSQEAYIPNQLAVLDHLNSFLMRLSGGEGATLDLATELDQLETAINQTIQDFITPTPRPLPTIEPLSTTIPLYIAPPTPTPTPTPFPSPTPDDRITIRWFIGLGTGQSPEQIEVEEQVVAEFNARQDEIELVTEMVWSSNAYDTMQTMIAAGYPPDIVGPVSIRGANTFPGAWLDLQPLVEQTNYDLSLYDPAVVDIFRSDTNGLQALPFGVHPSALFYNRELFDAAGLAYPPTEFGAPYLMPDGREVEWNYATVAELAKLLTLDANGNNATQPQFDPTKIVQFGFHFQWTEPQRWWANMQPVDFYDETTNRIIISQEWHTATDWLFEGVWQSHSMPNTEQINTLNNGNPFASGKIAMAVVPAWYTCCIVDNPLKWDVAVVPRSFDGQYHVLTDADTFFISANTQYPAEAFTVLQYLTTEAAPDLLRVYSAFPALPDAQAAYFEHLETQFDWGIHWDVFTRSLAYANSGKFYHEQFLPNQTQVIDRFHEFLNLLLGTEGATIHLTSELDRLESDLNKLIQPPPTPTPTRTPPPSPTPDDRITIRWFVGTGTGSLPEQLIAQRSAVEQFNARQDDIELVLETVEGASAFDRVSTSIAAGDPFDIVGPMSIQTANLFPAAWLDLQPLIEQTGYDLSVYDPAVVAMYQNDTVALQALPLGVYPSALFYNRELFDAAGLAYPPTEFGAPYLMPDGREVEWNYATVAELAKLLTLDANGNNATHPQFDPTKIVQFGFHFQWTYLDRLLTNLQPADLYDETANRITIPQAWRTATDWLFEGVWQSHSMPNTEQINTLNNGNPFASGQVAMTVIPLWYTCCLQESVGQFEWDVAVVPRSFDGEYYVVTDADTFFISADTQHPAEAFTVLQYLTTEAAPDLLRIYVALPALPEDQADYFARLETQYDWGIQWDVFTRSLAYANSGKFYHEQFLPNQTQVIDRLYEFLNLLLGTEGATLDVATELDRLESDLNELILTPSGR